MMIEFYCPSCGEWSEAQFSLLMAGEEQIRCAHCDTTWRVVIQFYEVEETTVITVREMPRHNLKSTRYNWRSA